MFAFKDHVQSLRSVKPGHFLPSSDTASIHVCLALLAVLLPYYSVHVNWMLLYPLITLNVMLMIPIVISYFSMEASIDVMAFFFQLVWSPLAALFSLRVNLMELRDEHYNHGNQKQQTVPRLIKQGLFFLLAQNSFVKAANGFEWCYTLLSYRLLANVTHDLVKENEKKQASTTTAKVDSCHEIPMVDDEPPTLSKKAEVLMAAASLALTIYYNDSTMTILSLTYFLLSEDILNVAMKKIVESLQIDFMEGLELCYMEGLLLIVETVLSVCVMSYLTIFNFSWSILPALYVCLYQPVQELKNSVLKKIQHETLCLAAFRQAVSSELKSLNDVCAVCLGPMNSARITECGHIFHGKCLKQCLREKPYCPMCNQRVL